MQSQQKRVKWSRGETAEALEERTDTGITQASVELMENCIPDIYGNVSRRPALKLITHNTDYCFRYDKYLQVFPFYITEDDYILVGVHYDSAMELVRIRDGGAVYRKQLSTWYPKTRAINNILSYTYKPVSYTQQSNYMLIADSEKVYKLQISNFDNISGSFDASCLPWQFSAGWYAPDGTDTRQVNSTLIPGLTFSGNFTNYTYTDSVSSETTVYSITTTGLTGNAGETAIRDKIPVGSIVQFPNIGCHLRVEGYFQEAQHIFFPDFTFDSVITSVTPIPSSGRVCVGQNGTGSGLLKHYYNGTLISETVAAEGIGVIVKCSAYGSGYATSVWWDSAAGAWQNWSEAVAPTTDVYIMGSLLTPVVDESANDTVVSVEYGYKSLQPTNVYDAGVSLSHPRKLLFLDQRLWAGAWQENTTQTYSIVIGSQIARYTDFKNNYNQENEAITLDILTQYRENIVHLIDYNGLKIMTNSFEYAYENGAVVKQSGNGSLENCAPLVFESLCLYCDSTGNQIRAMQYEFQSNIFNSSCINNLAPHDLIWYPYCMAAYEDKINSTGKHLFVVNEETNNNPRVAVCNFVPGNQANIWSRWVFPTIQHSGGLTSSIVHSVVNMKKDPIFMVVLNSSGAFAPSCICPAILDFNSNCDFQSNVVTINNVNYFRPISTSNTVYVTASNTQVAVYADGEFKWLDTTTSIGALTKSIEGLTNVTVGLPINATIRSHPIDVGGKTKSVMKRIGKVQMSVHDTPAGAITINGKTGYMNSRTDHICFYGVTGMKDEIKYTITNNNGAMFHLESLLMNIEYGTLDS